MYWLSKILQEVHFLANLGNILARDVFFLNYGMMSLFVCGIVTWDSMFQSVDSTQESLEIEDSHDTYGRDYSLPRNYDDDLQGSNRSSKFVDSAYHQYTDNYDDTNSQKDNKYGLSDNLSDNMYQYTDLDKDKATSVPSGTSSHIIGTGLEG